MSSRITLITPAASRADCLKGTIESLKKNLKYSGKMEKVLHEDVLNDEASYDLIKLAQTYYDKIYIDNPGQGHANAVNWLLEQVTTPYALYWEEDWELLVPLDLNLILDLMDRNKILNSVCFHKRVIYEKVNEFVKKEIDVEGYTFTTKCHWSFLPAVWRMSYLYPYIKEPLVGDPAWNLNRRIKGYTDWPRQADWNIKYMGSFYFGKIKEGHMVKNLAFERSARKGEYKW